MSETKLVFQSSHQQIADLIREAGYKAKLEVSEDWASIRTEMHDFVFWVEFSQCDETCKYCALMRFSSVFANNEKQIGRRQVDEWNLNSWSKAYFDLSDNVILDFPVNMREGVSDANFMATLRWFGDEVYNFAKALGWFEAETFQ
ncbi:MAG: YbjN domain-containing protein [Henriciella sp.]|nr:YbjN domain-containing protein [Henriciella sp.]